MKKSDDLVIGRSGDRQGGFTAEARSRGESRTSGDFSDPPILRSPSATAVLRNVMETIRAALREIFDESAYDRFLLRTNAPRSVASYRDFVRERDAAMLKRPRCC